MKALTLIPHQNRTLMCRVLYFLSAALNGLIASPSSQTFIRPLVTEQSFMIIKSLLTLRYSRTVSGVLRVFMYLLNLSAGLTLDVNTILLVSSEVTSFFSTGDAKIRTASFDCCLSLFQDHPYVLKHDQSIILAMGTNLRTQSKTQILAFINLLTTTISSGFTLADDVLGAILQGIVDVLHSLPKRKADKYCGELLFNVSDTIPDGLALMERYGIISSLEAYEDYPDITSFLDKARSL